MQLAATATLVTEIQPRSMLDLEELGGEGFGAEYAVFEAYTDAQLIVRHEGNYVILPDVSPFTRIPVMNYVSNALETS